MWPYLVLSARPCTRVYFHSFNTQNKTHRRRAQQVGQGVELMSMVGHLQDAGLVVDEKLDMIIKHMEIQEKQTAALEMRLAEYNDHIAEVSTAPFPPRQRSKPSAVR